MESVATFVWNRWQLSYGTGGNFRAEYAVVCYFDENLPESVAYALHCEDNLPATWDDASRIPR